MLSAMVVGGKFYLNALGEIVSFAMPDLPPVSPYIPPEPVPGEPPPPPPLPPSYVVIPTDGNGNTGNGGSYLASSDNRIVYTQQTP